MLQVVWDVKMLRKKRWRSTRMMSLMRCRMGLMLRCKEWEQEIQRRLKCTGIMSWERRLLMWLFSVTCLYRHLEVMIKAMFWTSHRNHRPKAIS